MKDEAAVTGNCLKVLIADDAVPVLDRISVSLSEVDRIHLVGKAKDVPEAIHLFDSLEPDLVILDIQMPGGSGLDVLLHIKRRRPGVVVLIMTSFPFPHYRDVSVGAGAEYFLDKSTALTKIKEVIKELVCDMPHHALNQCPGPHGLHPCMAEPEEIGA